MVFAEFDGRVRRRNARRIKLFVQMLTTAGYAGTGAALADPLFKTGTFGPANILSLGFGLAAMAVALYYVPQGEYDAS